MLPPETQPSLPSEIPIPPIETPPLIPPEVPEPGERWSR